MNMKSFSSLCHDPTNLLHPKQECLWVFLHQNPFRRYCMGQFHYLLCGCYLCVLSMTTGLRSHLQRTNLCYNWLFPLWTWKCFWFAHLIPIHMLCLFLWLNHLSSVSKRKSFYKHCQWTPCISMDWYKNSDWLGVRLLPWHYLKEN